MAYLGSLLCLSVYQTWWNCDTRREMSVEIRDCAEMGWVSVAGGDTHPSAPRKPFAFARCGRIWAEKKILWCLFLQGGKVLWLCEVLNFENLGFPWGCYLESKKWFVKTASYKIKSLNILEVARYLKKISVGSCTNIKLTITQGYHRWHKRGEEWPFQCWEPLFYYATLSVTCFLSRGSGQSVSPIDGSRLHRYLDGDGGEGRMWWKAPQFFWSAAPPRFRLNHLIWSGRPWLCSSLKLIMQTNWVFSW